jgi:hypothetical protein
MTCLSGNSKDYFGAGACAPGAVVVAMFTFIPSSTVAGECEPSLLSTLRMAASRTSGSWNSRPAGWREGGGALEDLSSSHHTTFGGAWVISP